MIYLWMQNFRYGEKEQTMCDEYKIRPKKRGQQYKHGLTTIPWGRVASANVECILYGDLDD